MKFRDMDELYSREEVTIFDICDYFSERYGNLIEVLWDCQDWGILKSLVCTKKTGVEIIDQDEEKNIVVIFYDKKRETVEEVERYLLSSEKYGREAMMKDEEIKIYKELSERRINTDGLYCIRVNGDDVILDCFNKEYISNEDSLIYKIMQFEDYTHVDWETDGGIKMVSIKMSRKCFSLILDLFH
jgi:hypothetical protein